jgi:hypothetical protein
MRKRQRVISFVGSFTLALMFLAIFNVTAFCEQQRPEAEWTQDYIVKVPPIMMYEPFYKIFGQTTKPVPYRYEEAVKISGHSCGAIAGAWTIVRKGLEALYPDEIPVRGQIVIYVPGAEDQWHLGVFGEVMTYVTGAAPITGFTGSEFGREDDIFMRRNKMIFTEKTTPTEKWEMEWIFERTDTKKRVGVIFDVRKIKPSASKARIAMGAKIAKGEATPAEAKDYIEYWNGRVKHIFANADTIPGYFTVTVK